MSTPHHPVLARMYDAIMMPQERLGFRRQRSHLCRLAPGNVVEVGVGTGLNLPHYERARRVVAVDPDPSWLARAARRIPDAVVPVSLMRADARSLPFRDGTVDAVVVGLSLCTIPDPAVALAEFRRIVADDGELHFLEHVRSPIGWVGTVEDRIAPLWKRVAGGCRPNQDTIGLIEATGWEITTLWTSRRGDLVQGTAVIAA